MNNQLQNIGEMVVALHQMDNDLKRVESINSVQVSIPNMELIQG